MSSRASASVESSRPAPEHFWIRHRPRRWPASGAVPWTDLSRSTLGRAPVKRLELPRVPTRPLDDVVYLPPVDPELEPERRALAESWSAAGTPVLLQLVAGVDRAPWRDGLEIWDLLPCLLGRDLSALSELPAGAATVWPLVQGLTDAADKVEEGLDRLRDAAVAAVQSVLLELSPVARRRLAEVGDEGAFDRLFHGSPPSERAFARRVADRGLASFLPRPLPPGPPRLAMRRLCAGELRLAAHLYHRLGRSEPDVQKLLRAARWIDREDRDLAALVEEGNLQVVEWIDASSREAVEDVVGTGRSRLVEALLAEYTSAA